MVYRDTIKPVMNVLKKYPTANAAEIRSNRISRRAVLSEAADNRVEFGKKNDSSLFIGANGARVKITNQDLPGNRHHFMVNVLSKLPILPVELMH